MDGRDNDGDGFIDEDYIQVIHDHFRITDNISYGRYQ